jgi:hypothetical protein
LVVIDEFTRECLAIEVARTFTAMQVIDVLPRISQIETKSGCSRRRVEPTKQEV